MPANSIKLKSFSTQHFKDIFLGKFLYLMMFMGLSAFQSYVGSLCNSTFVFQLTSVLLKTFSFCMCRRVWAWVHTCHGAHVEVRRQLFRSQFLPASLLKPSVSYFCHWNTCIRLSGLWVSSHFFFCLYPPTFHRSAEITDMRQASVSSRGFKSKQFYLLRHHLCSWVCSFTYHIHSH